MVAFQCQSQTNLMNILPCLLAPLCGALGVGGIAIRVFRPEKSLQPEKIILHQESPPILTPCKLVEGGFKV